MRRALGIGSALALLLAGCGGTSPDASASASRAIVISSTNTPGPPSPAPAGGPAAAVSTVLTPFATSTPAQSTTATALQTPVAAANNQVRIQDFSFTPAELTVKSGTEVIWTNNGPSNHTVTATDGSFDSGTIQRNGAFSFTFARAGTFAYRCAIHPSMQATVIVS